MSFKSNNLNLAIGGCAWMLVVCSGFGLVNSYDYTPGQPAKPPNRWPTGSTIQPSSGKANLVMMAHPRCPCTRASIGELEQLMAMVPGRLAAQVIFFKPSASE